MQPSTRDTAKGFAAVIAATGFVIAIILSAPVHARHGGDTFGRPQATPIPSARIGICNDVVSTVHATFEQTGEKVLRPGSCPGFRVEAFADILAAFVLGGLPRFNAAPEGGINNLEFG